jgi:hypothetical protein
MLYIIMNEITDTILVNLKIISKIAPNNKLKLINNTTTIEKEGMAAWLLRWYNGDSREKTVGFIKTVVNDSINITNDLMNSTYINNRSRKTVYEETEFTKAYSMLMLIKNEMVNSKTGILNLNKTYQLDIQIISQLEVVINKIDGHIGIIERKLKEIQRDGALPEIFMNKSDLKDPKEIKEVKEVKDVKDNRETRDIREPREDRQGGNPKRN